MWAAMIFGPRDVRVVEVPEPAGGNGDLLIKVRGVAPCGSDRRKYRTHEGEPRMWGHEVSGEVVEKGTSVPPSIDLGDHVVLLPVYGCMRCPRCESGQFVLCERPKVIDGGFAEMISVPWQIALPVPSQMPWEIATLLPDVVCVPAAALMRTSVHEGQRVLITGAGPIGVSAAMQAKLAGAQVAVLERTEERLAKSALYADVSSQRIDDPALSHFQPSVILECTGDVSLLRAAMDLVDKDGWVCSLAGGRRPLQLSPDRSLVSRMVRLTGIWCFYRGDFQSHIKPVLEGELDLSPLLSGTFELDGIGEALNAWDRDPSVMKVVVCP
jgi:threonine dehydrogenase-like Zn-dependent dehydrogenase